MKTVLFEYHGKRDSSYVPIMVSNFNNKLDLRVEFKENEELPNTIEEFRNQFNIFEGDFENNLNWSC